MKKLYDIISKITRGVNYLGLFAIFFVMMVTTIDVLLRKTGTGLSVRGSYELTEMAMVVLVFLAIPVHQLDKGHIQVTMLVDRLPAKARVWVDFLINLIETCVAAALTYGAVEKCRSLIKAGTLTDVLRIPQVPFAVIMLVGLTLLTIVLLLDTILLAMQGLEKSGGAALTEEDGQT